MAHGVSIVLYIYLTQILNIVGGGWWVGRMVAFVRVGTTVAQGCEKGLSIRVIKPEVLIPSLTFGLTPSQPPSVSYGVPGIRDALRRALRFPFSCASLKAICSVNSWLSSLCAVPGLWGGNHKTKLSLRPQRAQSIQSPRGGEPKPGQLFFLSPCQPL